MSESLPLPASTAAAGIEGRLMARRRTISLNAATVDHAFRHFSDPDLQPVALPPIIEMLLGSIAAGDPESVLHGPIRR